ncbi:hypothetical protein [Gillisia hiemivivida]|uniref:STAS/SEC14 domain-containing protein n=1 Tax=Gillisia hiemivivida TaxID=291190 RepID=A0A5C6ZQU8_9FLAO|nr:hypothetical protein [Gillisia hiemivivida]TXD93144.1 hypothetical protein ES724_11065 [Gillisia hiemivivida]
MSDLIKSVKLGFTTLDFYKNYVISEVNEEAVFSHSQFMEVVNRCREFYVEKKFVYISRRINNYSVDPTVYLKLEEIRKNLIGIAIVSNKVSSINMAEFEKTFSKVDFKIFLELDEAAEWAENLFPH